MNARQERNERGQSVLVESQIDLLCDEFERELKSGRPADIKSFLTRVPEESRAVIFRHLLHIDLEYRQTPGQTTEKQRYLAGFPEYADIVEEVFGTATTLK